MQDDLLRIRACFVEELFTYIKIWGSNEDPHVLPLYIPEKLLSQEIVY